jgi:hypothetical protein
MFNCYIHGWSNIGKTELDNLKAENARLREALELLAKDTSGTCCECLEIKDIAREALKGGE